MVGQPGRVADDDDAAGVVEEGGEDRVDGAAGAGDRAQEVDADGEAVVLADDAQGVAAEFDDGGDLSQVVAGQGDVGGFEGDVGGVCAHGDADVGEGGGDGLCPANSSPGRHSWLSQPPATSRRPHPARSGCCSLTRERTKLLSISKLSMISLNRRGHLATDG
ncbi:hypothetical protein OG863_40115 [Streptomyces decoyicus]|uniref:Uncharacterized protein n=1 Tax=Streptomyces decoyicus TaxID=249567 RepID=A0ABZ1FUP8_9ACTN|nr:hypothetical protein [Streptomyces decoyicus]WSB73652.1 hypothetical protein OG863_40115 [Streptomyces decoyicus]